MKKYLIFLALLLCSIILVPRETYAKISDYYSELKYSEEFHTKKSKYENDINLITQYLINNGMEYGGNTYNLASGNYIIAYNLDFAETQNIHQVMFIKTDVTPSPYGTYFKNRYSTGSTKEFEIGYQYIKNFFVVNNGVVSRTSAGGSNAFAGNSYFRYRYSDFNCNPTMENCTLYENDWFFDTSYLDNDLEVPLYEEYANSNTNYDIPLKVGRIIHLPGVTISFNEFFTTLNPTNSMLCNSVSDYKSLGTVYGLNTFDFVVEKEVQFPITSEETGIDSTLDGVFSFTFSNRLNPLPTTEDFTVVYTNDNNVPITGNYDFKCISNTCFLEYHYSTLSEQLINAKLTFVVTYIGVNTLPAVDISSCPIVGTNNYYTYSNSATGTGDLLNDLNNGNINLNILSNVSSWLPPGPLDSILTLPIKMIVSLQNSLHGTCVPLNISLPYVNSNLTIPCINTFYNNIGAGTFFNWVGVLASAIILLEYFVFLYNWLNNVFRFNEKNLRVWGTTGKGGYY